MERFRRTIDLIGEDSFNRLQQTTVIVFGVGGVGSFAVEALVRSGVGEIVLVDKDVYDATNINRQWPSNTTTIGKAKVDVVVEECLKISPSTKVVGFNLKLSTENVDSFLKNYLAKNLFVIDAIDDIQTKVFLLNHLKENNVNFISSMGAANVTDIDSIKYGLLDKTTHCPVAKIVRKELGLLGIKKDIPVVYSNQERTLGAQGKGSIMPITASFGLKLALYAVNTV